MNKKLIFAMAASLLLMNTACSNSEEPKGVSRPDHEHAVELEFDLAVSSGVDSRSGRELWSSQALQHVKDVDILVFWADGENETPTYVNTLKTGQNPDQLITDFTPAGSPVGSRHHNYKFATKLGEGWYTFLAVGYEDGCRDEVYSVTTQAKATFADGTSIDQAILTLKTGANVEEVFIGKSSKFYLSGSDARLAATITIRRAVAGVLGYFKNIPYEVEHEGKMTRVAKLTVEIVGKGNDVLFPTEPTQRATAFGAAEFPGKEDGKKAGDEYYELLSYTFLNKEADDKKIDITTYDATNNWYKIDKNDWTAEGRNTSKPAGVTKEDNSVLGGKFIMPFNRITTTASTLRVCLYDVDGTLLRKYPVVCKAEIKEPEGYVANKEAFSIFANNFYSLGHKYYNDPTNTTPNPGEDPNPDDPNPDDPNPNKPDEPLDLSKAQIITVYVQANWDLIHDLDVII